MQIAGEHLAATTIQVEQPVCCPGLAQVCKVAQVLQRTLAEVLLIEQVAEQPVPVQAHEGNQIEGNTGQAG